MASLTEIIWSLFGCYRLAIRDRNALSYFSLSDAGLGASFSAMLLAIPALVLTNILELDIIQTDLDLLPYLFINAIAYLMSWTAYLVFIGLVDQYFIKTIRFGIFVIVYNWTQFTLSLVWLPICILTLGLMGPEATGIFGLIFLGLGYVYLWYVLVSTLTIPGPTAAMLAFAEFVIALSIHRTALEIFYG